MTSNTANNPMWFIKYIQQNAQIFKYTISYLKKFAYNMFQSTMDHLQGGTTPINYVQNKNYDKIRLIIYDVS